MQANSNTKILGIYSRTEFYMFFILNIESIFLIIKYRHVVLAKKFDSLARETHQNQAKFEPTSLK
jgi:hypothetical protein